MEIKDNEKTSFDFRKMGYESLGWANQMNREQFRTVLNFTDDWKSGYRSISGFTNLEYSEKLKAYYQYNDVDLKNKYKPCEKCEPNFSVNHNCEKCEGRGFIHGELKEIVI